jgi:predicted Zn-dependent peptidase
MRDHQEFQKTVLPNGITAYTYEDGFPISCVEVILPVGSGHATAANSLIPGSPHLLEHAQLIRSQKYPEAYSLDRILGIRAGHSNGATHSTATNHWIDTPTKEQEFAREALIDRVFYPIIEEEDLLTERSVVMNERNQKKFYPGKSKASQYYYTEFINDVYFPLEQIFGSDKNLETTTPDILRAMHQTITRSTGIIALAVGHGDFTPYFDLLSKIETAPTSFALNVAPTTWVNKDFHTVYFETVAQPRLEVAWIHPRLDYKEFRALCFIINLLINTAQGPLYKEFREEKGWAYGLDGSCLLREYNTVLCLTFPVNTTSQVEFIRDCLLDRIHAALQNQELIEDEIKRQIGNQVYAYQTAGTIISGASTDLINYGEIHSETQWGETVMAMKDPAWRTYIEETYLKPDDMGSMCFMPERRQRPGY